MDEVLALDPSTPKEEVPFNLASLRDNLERVTNSRREYLHDPEARQRILEDTAFEAARARMERQAQLMKDLEINTGLKGANIQKWMWDWHQKLRARLATAIKALKATEKKGKGISRKL